MRLIAAAFSIGVALLTAACSSSSNGAAPSPTKPADLPAASQVTPDNGLVRAGSWGVVKSAQAGGPTDVFAIKVEGIVAGEAGDFADVQMTTGGWAVNLRTAVPYFVNYTYAVLAGRLLDAPPSLVVARGDSDSRIVTMSVPSDLEQCDPPADLTIPSAYGFAGQDCAVAVAAPGITPTTLVFDASPDGSANVQFAIPRS